MDFKLEDLFRIRLAFIVAIWNCVVVLCLNKLTLSPAKSRNESAQWSVSAIDRRWKEQSIKAGPLTTIPTSCPLSRAELLSFFFYYFALLLVAFLNLMRSQSSLLQLDCCHAQVAAHTWQTSPSEVALFALRHWLASTSAVDNSTLWPLLPFKLKLTHAHY